MYRKLAESCTRPIVLRCKSTSTYKCCTMPSDGAIQLSISRRAFSSVHRIPFSDLRKVNKNQIGKGVFGKCYTGYMSSNIHVCIKVFRKNDQLVSTFLPEAVLMSKLCHSNLPWLYGVSEHDGYKILVLSFHGVDGRSYTLHKALHHSECLSVTINWKVILLGLVSALKYIHQRDILHNDIKSDNIVIDGRSSVPQSILIDFGKGCFVSDAKTYTLSLKERRRYAIDHPQVAPDLRDGHCRQSEYSDVYSVGRVLNQINDKFLHIPFLASYASLCMQFTCTKRPSSHDLYASMQSMLKPDINL